MGKIVVRRKPPVAPNPYTSILKMQACSLSQPKIDRRVTSTAGFANDDWDNSDDDYNQGHCDRGFKKMTSSTTDENTNIMKSEIITGVPTDLNWLNENFDED